MNNLPVYYRESHLSGADVLVHKKINELESGSMGGLQSSAVHQFQFCTKMLTPGKKLEKAVVHKL